MGHRPTGRRYFSLASVLLLALTLLGFSDNLLTNVGQRSNSDPKFIIHGLFCLGWMAMFAIQANLVRAGNARLHRKLGLVAFLIAIGVTCSTLYLFIALGKDWLAMPPEVRMNRLLLPGFALLVLLAALNRHRADRHKRLLYLATLYMLEPVLSRAFDPFDPILVTMSDATVDLAWWTFFIVLWNGLFLSLVAYDRIVDRRLHPATLGGLSWFYAAWTIALFS